MDDIIDFGIALPAVSPEGFLPVGTLLHGGRYRIERYLASGGFGNTYVAADLTFERLVVLKEFYLKGTCIRNTESTVTVSQVDNAPIFNAHRAKFRKEAKRLFALNHPNIVRVFDLFDAYDTSYYTMNLLEGESLGERVKREGPMPESQVWPIFDQLLSALAYIHERHIWHLDIKPANILVDAKGHATLIDFGASKLIESNGSATIATSTAVSFTPGFAPLEQVSSNFKDFGPWTDFYALGATLYKLVSPNAVPSFSEIVADGDEAFAFPPQISQNLRELIIWMMKGSHKQRPQSVDAIRKKIEPQTLSSPKKPKVPKAPKVPVHPVPRVEPKLLKKHFSSRSSINYVKRRLKKWWWVAPIVLVVGGIGGWTTSLTGSVADTFKSSSDETAAEVKSDVAGTLNEHDYVDLNLPSGTLWATCNVGASSPEECGEYFAWGETKVKKNYEWNNYFDNTETGKYSKHGSRSELEAANDVATAKWGEGWQMPSLKQIEELKDNCSWTWCEHNGVQGYEVKSDKNNRSIFLPASGAIINSNCENAGSCGYYWSRTLVKTYSDQAYGLSFDSGKEEWDNKDRAIGLTVRPVLKSADK